jgi:hypothetical protein
MALVGLRIVDPVTSHSQVPDTSFIHSARFLLTNSTISLRNDHGIMRSIALALSILAFIQTLLLLLNNRCGGGSGMAGSKTPHNNNNVLSSNRISVRLLQSASATNHCYRHEHCRFVSSSPLPATVSTRLLSSPVLLVVKTAG